MDRLVEDMRAWMEGAKQDASNGQRYVQRGVMPSFDTLLDVRTVNIGMYPTFDLLEAAEGFEIPAHVVNDEGIRELKRLSSRLVAFGNELGGLAKDIAGGWPNLVLARSQERGVPVEEAFADVVDMHNADVETFDEVAARLPSWGAALDLQVQGWIRAVRYSVVGFTRWEAVAERYQRHKAVLGERVLAAPVTFFPPS
jgi:hypothetical protein